MNDPSRGDRVALALMLSGFLGFFLGMFGYPTWQAAVESAQVVAGVVHYPRENPFYIYHTKVWTLLHQIPALWLRLGLSEKTLSLSYSGLMGMVSFQSLALCVLAISGDLLVATLSPLLIFGTGMAAGGLTYDILLMGTPATPGVLGLSLILLAIALMAAGRPRIGGLLLGISPAVHPVLGLWGNGIAMVSRLWGGRSLRDSFREGIPFLLIGYLVSAASLALHRVITYDAPSIAPNVASAYLSAFVRHWDIHRRTFPLFSQSLLAVLGSFGMSMIWLSAFRKDLPREAQFLLRCFVVSAVLGVGLAMVHWLPPEQVPPPLLIGMPARLSNLNVVGFAALLLGLLARYPDRLWARLNLCVLALLMILSPSAPHPFRWMFLSSAALVWTRMRGGVSAPRRWGRILLWVSAGAMILAGVKSYVASDLRREPLRDWRNDPFFNRASKTEGLLLTGPGINLIQLRTRRPVLLDIGELAFLPYALEAGPETDRILRQVYGINLFDPPEEVRKDFPRGAEAMEYIKALWQGRAPEEWSRIKEQFHTLYVLTLLDWKLQLPEVMHEGDFVLYKISQQP